MIDNLLILIGISLMLYRTYKWITLHNDYFEKRGIQHLKPTFYLGNTAALYFQQSRNTDFVQKLYRKFPDKKIFGMFDFRTPLFFVRNPEVIKQLTVKDFDYFENRLALIDNLEDDVIFGNSLALLQSKKWRHMRPLLTPAFTSSKMRQMFELVAETSTEMVDFFTSEAISSRNRVDVQIQDLFSRFSMDVIASIAMGSKENSFKDEKNDIYVNGMKLLKFNSIRFVLRVIGLRIFPTWMKMLNISVCDSAASTFLRTMVTNRILTRERQGIFRPDMINIVMNLKKGKSLANDDKDEKHKDESFAAAEESDIGSKQVERQWTDDELSAQCIVFIFAGQETTTNLLSFMAHALAINPDIQERLYAEVRDVEKTANGKPLTYEALQKMKYFDMVVSEALRFTPGLAIVDRICVKDYEYDDGDTKFTFEKGMAFWIPIYALHQDEKYFPEPRKFDPERFNSHNKGLILSGTYIPFGIGPRNCIASRVGLLVAKCVMYYLVLRFKIETNEKTQIPLLVAKRPIGLAPEDGVHLRLILRK